MQLDFNYLWLRWLCFGGWVIAILGVSLKLSYVESIKRYEKIWLMGYVSFGICFLNGVVSELNLGINLPLFDIGWYMMGATIFIGFIIGIERQISNK